MKVVINNCHGGFSLSEEAFKELGLKWEGYGYPEMERNDPKLVACVEKLGSEKAGGGFAQLKIVEVPDNVDWYIEEYDGMEWVAERHRTWD